jgi:carbon-monoxide dehydrogenase medium subunit
VKPVSFDYARPSDIADATALSRRDDMVVKFIAGGQSLGPMLNLRLVQPDLLIDLTGIAELKQVDTDADAITIGACVTHADIEDGRVPDIGRDVLRRVAHGIAYRAVRNRGTVGGSISHADPAADWGTCLAALSASVVIAGGNGHRASPVEDFARGVFETALTEGELLAAVRVPRLSAVARWGYYKACRKTGEFAHAMAAVLHDPGRSVCRIAIGAAGGRPIVFAEAEKLFAQSPLHGAFDTQAVRDALQARGVRDPIEQQMHLAAVRRAIAQAAS